MIYLQTTGAQTVQAVPFIGALPGEELLNRYLIAVTDLLVRDLPCVDGVYDRRRAVYLRTFSDGNSITSGYHRPTSAKQIRANTYGRSGPSR